MYFENKVTPSVYLNYVTKFCFVKDRFFFFFRQPCVGLGFFFVKVLRSHSVTPHSVGLLWTSDQPDAVTSTWKRTTLTRDRHPYPRRDSNPQSLQASGRRLRPWNARPPEPAVKGLYSPIFRVRFPTPPPNKSLNLFHVFVNFKTIISLSTKTKDRAGEEAKLLI
jgi:hypothetical protein